MRAMQWVVWDDLRQYLWLLQYLGCLGLAASWRVIVVRRLVVKVLRILVRHRIRLVPTCTGASASCGLANQDGVCARTYTNPFEYCPDGEVAGQRVVGDMRRGECLACATASAGVCKLV